MAELMQDLFKRAPLQDVDPDETVALGATVQGGIKDGSISSEILITTDVAPFSMGVSAVMSVDG